MSATFFLTLFFPQTERGKLLIEEKGHKPAQKEEKTILCCRKGRIEEGRGDTKLAVYGGLWKKKQFAATHPFSFPTTNLMCATPVPTPIPTAVVSKKGEEERRVYSKQRALVAANIMQKKN